MPVVGVRSLVRIPDTERSEQPGRAGRFARALALFAFVSLTTLLVACSGAKLPTGNEPGSEPAPGITPVAPVSTSGEATLNLYVITFVIAIIVFFLVEGLLLFISFRFRRRKGDDELPKQTHGNNLLEILWTIVPALTVTALFVGVVVTLNQEEAISANPALTIDVTGFQWQWTFAYPDQGLKFTGTGRDGPVMALPVNETVHIRLHAADVIHSFYVPQFLYKKDVVPGRTNEFDVVVQQVGTFAGQCAEFCGIGHADMHFTVQAMSPPDFQTWVAQQQALESAAPSPGGSAQPGAQTVQVSSVSVTSGFNPNALTITANQPWTVQFTNADPSVPHNFSIHKANADGSDWLAPLNVDGGSNAVYNPPPLAPGDYQFFCSIHPNMVGTLHVQ